MMYITKIFILIHDVYLGSINFKICTNNNEGFLPLKQYHKVLIKYG